MTLHQSDFAKSIEKQRAIINSLDNIKSSVNNVFSSYVNFSQSQNAPVHRWFRFREGYSPDLVHAFLRCGEKRVLDPFCGSGTTLVCASQLGVDSFGIDINPMSVFITKVKTQRYSKEDVAKLKELSKKVLNVNAAIQPADPPNLKIINKIFPEDILNYLLRLKAMINSFPDNYRDFLFLGWLAILESVSNTRKEGNGIKYRTTKRTKEGYVHIPDHIWQKEYFGGDKIGFVRNKLQTQYATMLEDVEKNCLTLPNYNSEVHRGDAIHVDELLNGDEVSSAIFSPPYANCFDYFEIFKVELWMGGFVRTREEVKELKRNSLRSHVNSDIDSHGECCLSELYDLIDLMDREILWNRNIPNLVLNYFKDMEKAMKGIYDHLLPDGRCVIVVGNSAYGNVIIPTDLVLAKIGEKIGFANSEILVARHLTTSSQQKRNLEQLKQYLRESIVILEKT